MRTEESLFSGAANFDPHEFHSEANFNSKMPDFGEFNLMIIITNYDCGVCHAGCICAVMRCAVVRACASCLLNSICFLLLSSGSPCSLLSVLTSGHCPCSLLLSVPTTSDIRPIVPRPPSMRERR